MGNDLKQFEARPLIRFLAGLTCVVFVLGAVAAAFPGIVPEPVPPGFYEKPSYLGAIIMLWGATFFGIIAATGRFDSGRSKKNRLLLAARKFVSGQSTLEQYGAETRQLLGN